MGKIFKLTPKKKLERVLVVEDDEGLNVLLTKILNKAGYRVSSALNSDEALSAIKTNRFDIILCDVQLPGLNGYELFRIFKKQFQYTEIIMMTGAPDYAAAVQIAKEGAFEYLPKPFTPQEILDVVKRAANTRNEALEDDLEKTTKIEGGFLFGYNFIRNVGSGNMGDVMLVEKNGDCFALKQIRPVNESLNKKEEIKKLLDVVEAVAKIKHPNVVEILNYGIPNGMTQPFILMEYVNGDSLSEYIGENSGLNLLKKVVIIRQIISALVEVHKHNIVHRDIKPSNIILNEYMVPKITDFGISSIAEQAETIALAGSPAYMAPECFEMENCSQKSIDVFSLGVMSFELLTGKRPFTGVTISEMIHSIRTHEVPSLQEINPEIDSELENIINEMLVKDSNKRANIEEILNMTKEYLDK